MNGQKKTLLFGTLLTGGIFGLLYAYSKIKEQRKPVRVSKQLPKELILRILKEIQNEMFSVLSNIAMIANQLKQQARGRLPNKEIKEFLLDHTPQTKEQIKNVSESVCQKYGIVENDLKYACETLFQFDRDIQNLLNESKIIFDNAFMGVPPEIRTDVPDFLTHELTLSLMKNIMKESLFKINDFVVELKKKGVKISTENPQVLMGLQNLKIDDIRMKILSDKGLDKFQDSALKIFQYAIQKYTSENPDDFSQKLLKLEMQNQRAMKALMNGSDDAYLTIDAIGAHLAQSPEELMQSHLRNKRLHKAAATQNQDSKNKTKEEEKRNELQAINQIKQLQNQISFQLKNNLEDSEFPKEIVQSAVDTLFNVFDNVNKNYSPDSTRQKETEKILESVEDNNKVVKSEPAVIETTEIEVKKVIIENSPSQVVTTIEEKIVVKTEDGLEQIGNKDAKENTSASS